MFLSIVIPVYNTEKFLSDCIDSCLEQDIPKDDYEIICIDDGSTDASLSVLRNYIISNSNVRVVTQVNCGVSAARNTGTECAKGDYIWFLDSDDFIRPNCLSDLKARVYETDCSSVAFKRLRFSGDVSRCNVLESCETCGRMENDDITTVLFKKDLLDKYNLRFVRGIVFSEDTLVNYEFSKYDDNRIIYNTTCYFYRVHKDSVCNKCNIENTLRILDSRFKVLMTVKNDIDTQYNDQAVNLICKAVNYDISLIAFLPLQYCIKELRKYHREGFFSKKYNIKKWKVTFLHNRLKYAFERNRGRVKNIRRTFKNINKKLLEYPGKKGSERL